MSATSSSREFAQRARTASRKLQAMPTAERVAMLHRVADALLANEEAIMAENQKVSSSGHTLCHTSVRQEFGT